MTIGAHQPVGRIVGERLARARVFDELGIDYCCHGETPLDEACAELGRAVDDVLTRVDACDTQPAEPDDSGLPLGALADHIEVTHHVYLRSEIPLLEKLCAAVREEHERWHPELREVGATLAALHAELDSHMIKEERILFPMIRQLEAEASLPRFHCGSLANPIRVMEQEHDAAGAALVRLRRLTRGYVPPADACLSYRSLLVRLAALEADLHRHIHKENNLLFPRAAELEANRIDRDT